MVELAEGHILTRLMWLRRCGEAKGVAGRVDEYAEEFEKRVERGWPCVND